MAERVLYPSAASRQMSIESPTALRMASSWLQAVRIRSESGPRSGTVNLTAVQPFSRVRAACSEKAAGVRAGSMASQCVW